MFDTKVLFENVVPDKSCIKGNYCNFRIIIKDKIINNISISKIIQAINYLKKIKYNGDLEIKIHSFGFGDDTALLIFESLIYYLAMNYRKDIILKFKWERSTLVYYKFFDDSIINICVKNFYLDKEKYIEIFKSKHFSGSKDSIRIYINNFEYKENKNKISKVASNIDSLCRIYGLDDEFSLKMSSVVGEILDNVVSHTNSDAVMSFKIFEVVDNVEKKDTNLVSFSIVDLSGEVLGSEIRNKKENFSLKKDVIEIIDRSYNINKDKFNDKFDEEAFYLISTFQNKVTSRERDTNTGGTGLTQLIKELIGCIYHSYCYVISGNNCLYFKNEFLFLNDDGTIGFNDKKSYFLDIPSSECFKKIKYFYGGTAYNLLFTYGGLNEKDRVKNR